MGTMIEDAIIVSTFKREYIDLAHAKAVEIGLSVTNIVETKVNGYFSFMIAPDGSREGWPESDEGDAQRAAWIEWARGAWRTANMSGDLCTICYDSDVHRDRAFLHYVHVRFGELDGDAKIVGHLPDDEIRSWAARGAAVLNARAGTTGTGR